MPAPAAVQQAWIRRFHPADDAATRLVCLPHAGGSASFYFPVSRALSPQVDVLAVQYPGRQDRRHEPGVTDLHVLADLVAEQLRPLLDRPVALFGHSMGATLAFEVAHRLERGGIVAGTLFASGRRAPSCFRDERVHQRDDAGVIADVRRLSGTDMRIFGDEEMLRAVLPALRSDYTAIETYRCPVDRRIASPIRTLVGDSDPHVTMDEAQLWSRHTTAAHRVRVFDGGHFYLNQHAAEVIAIVKAELDVSNQALN